MTQTPPRSTGALWARFRFSVVGSLLSSPPVADALKTAIRSLAEKTWSHPVTGRDVRFSAVTIERWYYTAQRRARRPGRCPAPRRAQRLRQGIAWRLPSPSGSQLQYRDHPHWSYQLHYDNLAALVKADPSLGRLRSYSTVRAVHAGSWLGAPGPGSRPSGRPGEARRGDEAPDARDPQLRSHPRRSAVASRLPPRIAQGAHSRRPVAAADRAGHPR